jgi:murein DD-endopeptidase MepM/ murein hydrolase activator NlpD
LLFLAVVGIGLFGPGQAAVGVVGSWVRPVAGPVVRGFDPPRTRYGPGHRGVDFAVPPGTPVAAAGPGVVVFAGAIGPSSHVVVLHPASGWRTGYSFLESVAVHVGEAVAGGTVVGASGGTSVGSAEGHDGSVLHFSLRIGDTYVDPMILFTPLDLATVVHLAPTASDRSGMGFARADALADGPPGAQRVALADALRADGDLGGQQPRAPAIVGADIPETANRLARVRRF